MATREKLKGNTMVLPNIPKMTDDKNKLKYMTDYEKYEGELLKHHLGHPESTITMGLKNIPVNFDRTVPSLNEPTAAEMEYEKYLAVLSARRKKKKFGRGRTSYARDIMGSSATGMDKLDALKSTTSASPYGSGYSPTFPLPVVLSPPSGPGSMRGGASHSSLPGSGQASFVRHSTSGKCGPKGDHLFGAEASGTDGGGTEPGVNASTIQGVAPSFLSASGILTGEGGGKGNMADISGLRRTSSKVIGGHSVSYPRRSFLKPGGVETVDTKSLPSVTFPLPSASILAPPAVTTATAAGSALAAPPAVAASAVGGTRSTSATGVARPSSVTVGVDANKGGSLTTSTTTPWTGKQEDASHSSLHRVLGMSTSSFSPVSFIAGRGTKEGGVVDSASSKVVRLLSSSNGSATSASRDVILRGADSGHSSGSGDGCGDRHKRAGTKIDRPTSAVAPTSSRNFISSTPKMDIEKKTTAERFPSRAERSRTFSAPARSHPPSESTRAKKNIDLEEAEKYLLKNSLSFGRSPSSSKLDPVSVGDDLADCADLLRVLVDPPKEYAASLKLDLKWLDIDWIVHKRSRPPQLTTLHNWQSLHRADYTLPHITSPRSALVLLRNGVSMQDLLLERVKDDDVQLPHDPALRVAVQNYRREREKVRRDDLAEMLLSDYHNMCSKYSQQDLITAVNTPVDISERQDVRSSTSLSERQEKQRKQFEINKLRMARVNELAESLHEKRKTAEERRRKAEVEQREALEAKLRSEAEARRAQQERLIKQRQKMEEMEQAYLENLKHRQELAEKRNEERLLAQARQFELRQKVRHEKEEERKKRFAHTAALQEQQAMEVELKRLQAEKKMAEIDELRRLKIVEEKRLLKEKQERVKEARKEAARRAAEQEESVRETAFKRQQEVEERLARFIEMRGALAVKRAKTEEEKKEKRLDALINSKRAEEEFKRQTEEKQLKHMEMYNELANNKLLHLTLLREKEREAASAKAFAIKQLQRMEEFKKIRNISNLILKRRIAEHLEEQRAKLLQESLAERDKLYREKQELRQRLAAEKV